MYSFPCAQNNFILMVADYRVRSIAYLSHEVDACFNKL